MDKYRDNREKTQHNEHKVIDDIIKELAKKREIAIHKKKRVMLKDEVSMYILQETTLDYVLFRIRKSTSRLI